MVQIIFILEGVEKLATLLHNFHLYFSRMGFALSGKCRPSMLSNQQASELSWKDIRNFWHYDDLSRGGIKSSEAIPTLQEWLQEFAEDPRLRLIWLDVKILHEDKLRAFVKVVHSLIREHKIPAEKIQFSTHQEGISKLCHSVLATLLAKIQVKSEWQENF